MTLIPDPQAPWWAHAFATTVQKGARDVELDRAVILLSAHRSALVPSNRAVERELAKLDEIAVACRPATFDGWQRQLFVELGLAGNGADYHDVRNSFLPDVVARRVGIPVSLSVIGIEVGRRLGLSMWGVGMPGHFLLGHGPTVPGRRRRDEPVPEGTVFVDAFNGGAVLDVEGCTSLFRRFHGEAQPFDLSFLAPIDSHMILVRMLANLKSNYARARDIEGLAAVLRLRACLPGLSLDEARELVRLLDATGRVGEAWNTLDLITPLYPNATDVLRAERDRIASRLN